MRAFARLRGIIAWLFFQQLQVVQHPCRWKAVLTPRRGGKTITAVAWILDWAIRYPGRKFLYVALTRPNAKDIAWGIFKDLYRRFEIGDVDNDFHESALDIHLPNGSTIMLRGADQAQWVERLEGQEFKLIIVDEAAQFNLNVRKLVYGSMGPMIAKEGTICLISRPGDIKFGLFYDLTRDENRMGPQGELGGWTVDDKEGARRWQIFNWSTFDNPFMSQAWKDEIAAMIAVNPEAIHSPINRRHYFGEWAEDSDKNVYAFDENRDVIDAWEQVEGDRFGATTDFGWNDAQAFCVGCWNPKRPDFTIVESFSRPQMPLSDALAQMAAYQARYPGLLMWGDPARKQLYMELAIRFGEGAVVNPAEKSEKQNYQVLFNNDLALKRIKIVRATNQKLIDEMKGLKKLVKEDGTWIEHPRQPNDLCDTALYTWRQSMHFRYKEVAPGPKPGTPQFDEMVTKQIWEREAARRAQDQKKKWWHR